MAELIGDRIRRRLDELHMLAKDVLARTELTSGNLSLIMSGKNQNIKANTLLQLATALECDPIWLLTGGTSPTAAAPPTKENGVRSFCDCVVSVDPGNSKQVIYTPKHGGAEVIYPAEFFALHNVDAAACRRVITDDDHMFPAIQPGDVLMIDTAFTRFNISHVYAIFSDEIGVRPCRLSKCLTGGVIVKYDNSAYSDEELTREQLAQLWILGRVFERSGAIV